MGAAALALLAGLAVWVAVPGSGDGDGDGAASLPAAAPATPTGRNVPPVRDGMLRGANVTAYLADALSAPTAADALRDLRAAGADQATFPVLWFQAARDSTAIAPDPHETPSDASIVAAAATARGDGMQVGIAPHLNVRDGTFRGDIAPASRGEWMAAYRRMVEHYADLAQQVHADLFVVGSELASMSGDDAAWRSLIADVRGRFDGQITYAANWVQEAEKVPFWDVLDAVGIDAYMPLTPKDADPSVTQLEAGWQPWITRMQALHDRTGKPVLVTELGYTSRVGTAQAPAEQGDGAVSLTAQANAYEAAFSQLGHRDWVSGIAIWDWSADGRQSAGDYSPQGKPAQAVLARWYGGTVRAATAAGGAPRTTG
ncbi:glycoside hydrolase family 113 [Capillimicrobium parvum]|uniref:GTA TIM-barrel-like domain-containing protein n=1 Tax=Capillimicrobium parvum TaxID=2884022 RepID=A0A9E6XUV1_9ACTN|nr:glycoside hydrolase TIM-barrel-like domain-containing protein [Capillimicrobium parvum]UGS34884.1 hypothetical protein DSM104329_01266 [Capillimicrobium parvum]